METLLVAILYSVNLFDAFYKEEESLEILFLHLEEKEHVNVSHREANYPKA